MKRDNDKMHWLSKVLYTCTKNWQLKVIFKGNLAKKSPKIYTTFVFFADFESHVLNFIKSNRCISLFFESLNNKLD